MTLYKQILAFVIFLFAGLLIIAYAVQFQSTRDLAEQQRVSVINTANSVGIALTPYLETGDKVGAESIINAAFDGGYYQEIHLDLLASKQTIEKTNKKEIEGVPGWFIQLNLFKSETYESILTSGWLQLGKLQVKKDIGRCLFSILADNVEPVLVIYCLFYCCLRSGCYGITFLIAAFKPHPQTGG